MPKYLYRCFFLVFLTVLFGIFKNTPLYLIDKLLGVASMGFCLFYVTYSYIIKRDPMYRFSRRAIFIFMALLICAVITTKVLYKQKFVDSITAQIDCFQVFLLAFFAYAFYARKLKPETFEFFLNYFIVLNIIILVLFRNYASTGESLTGGHALVFKSQFLPKEFVRFGAIYYFVVFLRNGKYKDILISIFLLMFPNIIIHFERGYFAVTVMMMFLTVLLIRKSRQIISKIVICIFIGMIVIVTGLSFAGSFGATILNRYTDIINGINTGSSEDASVNYRLKEVVVGMKLWERDPWFGAGKINSANIDNVAGMDYYPSDVGVIGILSVYGVVGMAVYAVIFVVAIFTFFKTLKYEKRYSIITVCLGIYFLSLCIESVQTAIVMLVPAYWSFLYIFYLYSKRLDTENYIILQQELLEEQQAEEEEKNILLIT